MAFSIDSKVKDLLNDAQALEVLKKYVPTLAESKKIKLVQAMSFRKVAGFPQANLTPEKIEEIDNALKALG